ncbi:MAG: hypothetical protein AABZ53_11970 [Planctomycetota bacterium]
MDQEHFSEFAALREQAERMLRLGEWSLRLEILPSFADSVVVGLHRSGWDLRVVERRWDRAADAEKFRSPVERMKHPRVLTPTLQERAVPTDKAGARQIRALLGEAAMPLRTSSEVLGLDGTRYSIIVSESMHSAHVSWWESFPAEWLPVMRAFGSMWKELEGRLGAPSTPRRFPWNT